VNVIIMAALGAGIGLGLLLAYLGWRGIAVVPDRSSLTPSGTSPEVATGWLLAALAAGIAVGGLTGWIGAGIGTFALVLSLPWFVLGGDAPRDAARTEAIATWTEMIRDNMAGAAGLEQAIVSTAAIAPGAIETEVQRMVRRLDQVSLPQALVELGRDLDHPSADLVVVALVNATRMESRDLGSLLTRLADSIRAEVRMRLRIEVGRTRIRTSSRIVLAVTLGTVVLVYATSQDLLEPYDTAVGQLVLISIYALFVGALWLMQRFSGLEIPERFTVRDLDAWNDGKVTQ
jgi:Flp pilus assembly protein TadB